MDQRTVIFNTDIFFIFMIGLNRDDVVYTLCNTLVDTIILIYFTLVYFCNYCFENKRICSVYFFVLWNWVIVLSKMWITFVITCCQGGDTSSIVVVDKTSGYDFRILIKKSQSVHFYYKIWLRMSYWYGCYWLGGEDIKM